MLRPASVAVCLAWLAIGTVRALELVNGDLTAWSSGLPDGWQSEIGAANGKGPESKIAPLSGGGAALSGDAQTAQWRALSQQVALAPGKAYQLTFEARVREVRREGSQFDNCYVGLVLRGSGPKPQFMTANIDGPDWTPGRVMVRTPADLNQARVMIFLSKSGALEVRKLRLDELDVGSSFQLLVDDMDRYYSLFEAKGVDWPALVAKHRKAAEAAGSPEAFAKVVGRMLGELQDLHVTVRVGDGPPQMTHRRKFTANYELPAVVKSLRGVERFEPAGLVGRTTEGYGYLALASLAGDEQAFEKLLAAVDKLRDAPAMLIDLRPCNGGDERRGMALARRFNDQPRVYARALRRSGPRHGDLAEQPPRTLPPAEGEPFAKPVIVLLGPQCVSSGEGLAQMLAVLPQATLIGQPTGGASGNPAPIELPNGVTVTYSRWVDLLPDGTPLEGRGVVPEVVVEHKKLRGRDTTFEAARAEARKRTGK